MAARPPTPKRCHTPGLLFLCSPGVGVAVKVLDDDTFSSQTMGTGFTGATGKYAIDVNPKDVSRVKCEEQGQGCHR